MPFSEEQLRQAPAIQTKMENGQLYVRSGDDSDWIDVKGASGSDAYSENARLLGLPDVPPGIMAGTEYTSAAGVTGLTNPAGVSPSDPRIVMEPKDEGMIRNNVVSGGVPEGSFTGDDVYTKWTPTKPVMSTVTAALFREASIAVRFFKSLETVEAAIQADRLEGALADLRADFHFPFEETTSTVSGKIPDYAESGERGLGDSSAIVVHDPNARYTPPKPGHRKVRRR